jgi:hypothetical protein
MLRMTKRLIVAAVFGLPLVAQAQAQPAGRADDLSYCAKLSDLYVRYVGRSESSPRMGGVMPNVEGGVAMAKCKQGDAAGAIPTLERLLTDGGFTLPPRG